RNRERRRVEPVVYGLIRRVDRHARNQIRTLAGGITVKQVRRLSRQRDVERQPGASEGDAGQRPSAQDSGCKTVVVQKCLARSERQLVDGAYRHGVTDVYVRATAVAGAAALMLDGHGFAGADRSVGDSV